MRMRVWGTNWKLHSLSQSETERSETVLNRFRGAVKPSTWSDRKKGGKSRLQLQCSRPSVNTDTGKGCTHQGWSTRRRNNGRLWKFPRLPKSTSPAALWSKRTIILEKIIVDGAMLKRVRALAVWVFYVGNTFASLRDAFWSHSWWWTADQPVNLGQIKASHLCRGRLLQLQTFSSFDLFFF